MNKASLKRHADFRTRISKMLTDAGAKLQKEDEYKVELTLDTKRIGTLQFTMWKRDAGNRADKEHYALFIHRLPLGESHVEAAELTKEVSYFDHMGLSGKWNILFSDPEDIYNELGDRLEWAMRPA